VHPVYRERLFRAGAADTVLTRAFDGGWPDAAHRVLRNTTLSAWEDAERPEHGRPGEGDVVATRDGRSIERYDDAQPTEATSGEIEAMALYAGTSVESVTRCEPAAAIVARISGWN
jgi:NAD(P)H-dependent flavin oxidoreductase YrpB (nitropropane dioxygenase family)